MKAYKKLIPKFLVIILIMGAFFNSTYYSYAQDSSDLSDQEFVTLTLLNGLTNSNLIVNSTDTDTMVSAMYSGFYHFSKSVGVFFSDFVNRLKDGVTIVTDNGVVKFVYSYSASNLLNQFYSWFFSEHSIGIGSEYYGDIYTDYLYDDGHGTTCVPFLVSNNSTNWDKEFISYGTRYGETSAEMVKNFDNGNIYSNFYFDGQVKRTYSIVKTSKNGYSTPYYYLNPQQANVIEFYGNHYSYYGEKIIFLVPNDNNIYAGYLGWKALDVTDNANKPYSIFNNYFYNFGTIGDLSDDVISTGNLNLSSSDVDNYTLPDQDDFIFVPYNKNTGSTYSDPKDLFNDYALGNVVKESSNDPSGPDNDPSGWNLGKLIPSLDGGFDFDFDLPDFNIDWSLGDLSDKFPFSIPFDLYKFFAVLNAEPECPHLEGTIDLGIVDWDIDWDLEQFDDIAQLLRNLEFIGFSIVLIVLTRQIIKG